jgi:hypothetical protein
MFAHPRRRIARTAVLLPLVTLAFALVACGDSTGPSDSSIAGTYSLSTVNGMPVPVTIFQIGDDKLEIATGTLTLGASNTFNLQIGLRYTEEGVVTTETDGTTGTYTRNGGSLVFTAIGGETSSGSVSGNSVTMSEEGLVLVFGK